MLAACSCMPTCWGGENDNHELILLNPQKPEQCDSDLETFYSPIPGHAVALEGVRCNMNKNQDLEDMMAFMDAVSESGDDDDQDCFSKNVDGQSTSYDSTSESDAFSTDMSEGETGPPDLVVVGRSLLHSGSESNSSDDFARDMSDGELGHRDLMVVGHSLLHQGRESNNSSSERAQQQAPSSTTNNLVEEKREETVPAKQSLQKSKDRSRHAGWWNEVDVGAVPGLEEAPELTTLLDARVIKTQRNGAKAPSPWLPGQSSELYTAMGMEDPSKCYVAVWLNLGGASLLFVLELKADCHDEWVKTCLDGDFLSKRLKFLSNPVKMRGAMPSTPPKDAEAVGTFFGKRSTSCTHDRTDAGVPYICIQLDVFSKWYVKVAFQQVALRLGNILELVLVDGPSTSVLAGCRLTVTTELLQLLAA